MTYSNFIGVDYLYKHTVIDRNVDADLLTPFIVEAQDINIQRVIGNTLYVRLMADISSNTISGYYKTLLDSYIQKATAQWTLYHCLPYINHRITNKAVSEKKSDNSDVSSDLTVNMLRSDARDKATFYNQRITEYIVNNINQFPEYTQWQGLNIRPKSSSFFGGIYIPKSKSRCNNCGQYNCNCNYR